MMRFAGRPAQSAKRVMGQTRRVPSRGTSRHLLTAIVASAPIALSGCMLPIDAASPALPTERYMRASRASLSSEASRTSQTSQTSRLAARPATAGEGRSWRAARGSDTADARVQDRSQRHVRLAFGYLQAGRADIALSEAEQALSLGRNDVQAWHAAALAASRLGQTEAGLHYFAAALAASNAGRLAAAAQAGGAPAPMTRQDDAVPLLLSNYAVALCAAGRREESTRMSNRARDLGARVQRCAVSEAGPERFVEDGVPQAEPAPLS